MSVDVSGIPIEPNRSLMVLIPPPVIPYSRLQNYKESLRRFFSATPKTPDDSLFAHHAILLWISGSQGSYPSSRYSAGYSVKEICGILGIRKILVYQTHTIYGLCYNPNTRKRGRHRKLISTDINFIKLLISEHPTIYLDEIQEQLLTRRGAQISISTLLGILCHLHLLSKDVSGHALERNISSVLFFRIGWRIWWRTQTC